VGKLLPKSTGPYEFVKYKGRLRTIAIVRATSGKLLEFAAGHLIPLLLAAPAAERGAPDVRGGELLAP
jgi:hypothetical protein